MSKLVSLHLLMLSAAESIPPQHVFEATAEEQEFLEARNAVRKYNAEQDKGLKVFERVGSKASAGTGATEQVDITKANKEKLLEIAAAEGVELKGDETVAQLREAITAKRTAGNDGLV